jgi:hypothetical protein
MRLIDLSRSAGGLGRPVPHRRPLRLPLRSAKEPATVAGPAALSDDVEEPEVAVKMPKGSKASKAPKDPNAPKVIRKTKKKMAIPDRLAFIRQLYTPEGEYITLGRKITTNIKKEREFICFSVRIVNVSL